MLRSQAHSFRQQARLAVTLSWVAGYTNALTVLECHQVTSHVTGTVSQIGVEVAEGHWPRAAWFTGLVLMFLGGAFASGLLTELGRVRRLASIYVLPMTVEALVLAAFAVVAELQAERPQAVVNAELWLTLLPTFAMGVQNATITRISGGVVRTSHVSGVVTDLGLQFARLVFLAAGRRRRIDLRRTRQERHRALLLTSILGSFVLGCGLGTLCFDFLEPVAMVPAVVFLFLLVTVDVLRPIAPVELRLGNYRGAPIIALYHAEPRANGNRPRLPDLTTWATHLDDHVRVVVLDLTAMPVLRESAALEIRGLAVHLRAEGRTLVLAGIGQRQAASLRQAGVLLDFDDDDLCADLAAATDRAEDIAEEL